MPRHWLAALTGSAVVTAVAVASRSWMTADDAPAVAAPVAKVVVQLPGPSGTPAPDPVAPLLTALATGDAATAEQRLVDRGPAVLDRLDRLRESAPDPEVRACAATAAAVIREHDSDGVSLITMDLPKLSPQVAFDRLAAQARCRFSGIETLPTGPTVTLNIDREPFWDALADVCKQLAVTPALDSPADGSIRLSPVPRGWFTDCPHQVVGPYWIGVAGVHRTRSIDLAGAGASDDRFDVQLIVYPEPKLSTVGSPDFQVEAATDDAGNSLIRPTAPPDNSTGRTVLARLAYPARPGRRITTLAGTVHLTLAEGVQCLHATGLAGKPTISNPVAGCDVRIAARSRSQGFYELTIDCDRTDMDDAGWSAMTDRMDTVTVTDAAGHALRLMNWTPAPDNTPVSFRATALCPGPPAALAWDIPSRFKPVAVPVQFHDLPMP